MRFKMDAAVSERSYAEAEQYRVRLAELAEEKTLAAEKEQHQHSGTSPLDTVAKVGWYLIRRSDLDLLSCPPCSFVRRAIRIVFDYDGFAFQEDHL